MNVGIRPGMDLQLEKRVVMCNYLAMIFALSIAAFAVAFYVNDLILVGHISVVWAMMTVAWIFANQRGWYLLSRVGLILTTDTLGFFVCWSLGQDTRFHVGYFAVIGTPLLLFTFKERKYIFGGFVLAALCYFVLDWMPPPLAQIHMISPIAQNALRVVIDVAVIAVIFMSVFYLHRMNNKSEQDLINVINLLGDVNEQLNLSIAETKSTQALLMQSEKMAALGEMAGGVAHEINTPLATILLRAELLAEQVEQGQINPVEIRSSLGIISNTVGRISRIIVGLRNFCREGSTDPMVVKSIKLVIDDTLALCGEKFRHHSIEVRLVPVDPKIELLCQPTQIGQVLLNLLINAFDAVSELQVKWIAIEVQESEQFVEISVTDSGVGVSSAIRDKIFQPFFTTKEIGKGTGLGLSLAKGLVDAHKGTLFIRVESPNTQFVIRLPKTATGTKHLALV
jgi:signal transduction histidine kinase